MSRLSREKMRESEIGETDVGGEIIDMSPSHFLAGNHLSGMRVWTKAAGAADAPHGRNL